MTFKEYKNTANINGKWSFLVWFIKTKECHYILLGLFILLIIFLFVSPESVMKIKMAFWNFILNKMK